MSYGCVILWLAEYALHLNPSSRSLRQVLSLCMALGDFEDVTKDFVIKRSPWYWTEQYPYKGPWDAGIVALVAPERVSEKWSVKQGYWLKPEESGLT